MASNSKKTKRIRDRKRKPNKANQKSDRRRIEKNREILRELESKDAT